MESEKRQKLVGGGGRKDKNCLKWERRGGRHGGE